jgi:hypothetical protein
VLNSLQPGCHLLRCEHVSLATNRQRTFEDFEQFLERERVCATVPETAVDIVLAAPAQPLARLRKPDGQQRGAVAGAARQ